VTRHLLILVSYLHGRYSQLVPALNQSLEIRVGTSAFVADGWETSFYPKGMKPADYLTYYATKFDTVEIDSTFYRAPSAATVNGWARKTPDDFIFAVKVPQTITHEKMLRGADGEFKSFVETMDFLGEKLGPMVLQFPYFNRTKFKSAGEFIKLLKAFMEKFPKDHRLAVEIRNRNWLDARFADALRERNVALVLQDQSWMPRPTELFEKFDPITADFTYIRWLGDRKGIEERTKMWDKVIVDRTTELNEWVEIARKAHKRRIQIFAYANNHYAGHAPATVEQFQAMLGALDEFGPTSTVKLRKVPSEKRQSTLFDS
jgi:uncharacterized protein YecE (DUF72 family)